MGVGVGFMAEESYDSSLNQDLHWHALEFRQLLSQQNFFSPQQQDELFDPFEGNPLVLHVRVGLKCRCWRTAFRNRSASGRTTALSFALWLRKTSSYGKSWSAGMVVVFTFVHWLAIGTETSAWKRVLSRPPVSFSGCPRAVQSLREPIRRADRHRAA